MKRIVLSIMSLVVTGVLIAEEPIVTDKMQGGNPITGGFLTKPINATTRQIVILNSSTNMPNDVLEAFADKILKTMRLYAKVVKGNYTEYDNSGGDAILVIVDDGEMIHYPKKNLVLVPIDNDINSSLRSGLLTLCGLDGSEPIIKQNITIMSWAKSHGLTSAKRVSYKKACEEGWAPAPTNDVQKAIWERVKAAKAAATNAPAATPPAK